MVYGKAYDFVRIISSGSMGAIVRYQSAKGPYFAVKVFTPSARRMDSAASKSELECARLIQLMRTRTGDGLERMLAHVFATATLDIRRDYCDVTVRQRCAYIFMEEAACDLFDYRIKNGYPIDLSLKFVRSVVVQLARSLSALYMGGFIACHGDIKPENILITHRPRFASLVDFGGHPTPAFSSHEVMRALDHHGTLPRASIDSDTVGFALTTSWMLHPHSYTVWEAAITRAARCLDDDPPPFDVLRCDWCQRVMRGEEGRTRVQPGNDDLASFANISPSSIVWCVDAFFEEVRDVYTSRGQIYEFELLHSEWYGPISRAIVRDKAGKRARIDPLPLTTREKAAFFTRSVFARAMLNIHG